MYSRVDGWVGGCMQQLCGMCCCTEALCVLCVTAGCRRIAARHIDFGCIRVQGYGCMAGLLDCWMVYHFYCVTRVTRSGTSTHTSSSHALPLCPLTSNTHRPQVVTSFIINRKVKRDEAQARSSTHFRATNAELKLVSARTPIGAAAAVTQELQGVLRP